MKPIIGTFRLTVFSMLVVCLAFACNNDEDPIFDNSLKVLVQQIDDTRVENGVDEVGRTPTIGIVFSHTLNTNALESALSFSGPGGTVAATISYTNTNSVVNISPDAPLEYFTTYSINVPTGIYGQAGNNLEESYSFTFTTAPFVPANITLAADVLSIGESDGTSTVTIELSEMLEEEVSVELDFAGSATLDTDYTASASMITIPVGETVATVTLNGINDGAIEGTEEIVITIANVVNAVELTPQELTITLLDDDLDSNGDGFPDQGFIINEVLFDPPGGDAGDANGDGTRSPSADEFIEFVNDSDQPVDLSGFTLYDATNLESGTPRHTFPDGTVVPPGGVYVLFGGGTPAGDFGNAQVAVSTTGNMNFSNADDVITILDASGNTFLTFDTQVEGAGISFGEDQSVTRNPDINGDFALHTTANMELAFSPGKTTAGENLGTEGGDSGLGFRINEVLFDPPGGDPGDANGDGTRSASADEFIEFVNDSDQSVDLSGFTLFDATNLETMTPRHTFPPGTVIPPGGVYVLFGGGTPTGDFGNAQVAVTTTGNMNLSNADDVITILDASGNTFLTFDTQVDGAGIGFGEDQSVTRSPDISGDFILHSQANPGLLFSPGKKVDGTDF
jgi:hypothetical protein